MRCKPRLDRSPSHDAWRAAAKVPATSMPRGDNSRQERDLAACRAVAGVHAPPAAAAERIVHIQAELREGPIGDGLHHSWQAGLGGGVRSEEHTSELQS